MELVWTIARVAVSLAVVLGLLWVLGRAARRRAAGGAHAEVSVLGRQALTRSASVAVVRVGGSAMVLGVTDASVTLLGTVDPDELAATSTAAPARGEEQDAPAFEHVLASVAAQPSTAAPLTRAELRSRSGRPAPTSPAPSALTGSALDPGTWTRAVGVLRERGARR